MCISRNKGPGARMNCYCFRNEGKTSVTRMMEIKAHATVGFLGDGIGSRFYSERNEKPLDVFNQGVR